MGKYRRYKNRIEMFLASERGKRALNFCYSWGASIVIIGALFKLLHLPYGNQILFVAMTVEALVFFISAFEHPSSEYHWEEVFPVLKSKNPMDRPDFAKQGEEPQVAGMALLGHQFFYKIRSRMAQQFFRPVILLYIAFVHHQHLGPQLQGLRDIVGDEHHRDAGLGMDSPDLCLQLPSGDLIHRPERFIHQQYLRRRRQRRRRAAYCQQ